VSDERKIDWQETDRIMQQLREKIAQDQADVQGGSQTPVEEAPVIAEEVPAAVEEAPVIAEEVPAAVEEAPVIAEEAPAVVEEAPAVVEEAPAVVEEPAVPVGLAAPAVPRFDEIGQEMPRACAPASDSPSASVPDTPVPEVPTASTFAEDGTSAETATPSKKEDAVPKQRRKRKKIPQRLPEQQEVAPMDEAAVVLAAKQKRAAELAEQQKADLYWRQSPMGGEEAAASSKPAAPRPVKPSVEKKQPKKRVTPTFNAMPSVTPPKPVQSAKEPVPTPVDAEKERKKKENEQIANVTVDGLLSDIFGSAPGAAGHVWFDQESHKKSPKRSEETEKQEEPQVEKPAPAPPARYAPIEETAATVECGGQRVILPLEEESTKEITPAGDEKEEGEVKLFSAFSVGKHEKEGARPRPSIAKASADQIAFKRSVESSEDDFRLLLDLDYEDELGNAIGFEKIKEYRERSVNGEEPRAVGRRRIKKRFEYGSHAQDIGLCKFYAKQRSRHVFNLAVSVLLMLVLFFYEHPRAMRLLFGGVDAGARYPSIYILVGLLIFMVDVVLLRRRLIEGFVSVFRLSPNVHSFSAVTVALTLVYHIALFFMPYEEGLALYLSPAAFHMSLLALSNLLDWYREFGAFRVISSKRPKYALMSSVSVGGREGDAKLRLRGTESGVKRWYIRPVNFVRNYFANTEKHTVQDHAFGAQLLLTVAVSLAFGLYGLALGSTARACMHTVFAIFLLCSPAVSVLTVSLPMFLASCLSLKRKGAIIGEEPIEACGGKNALVLPDDEIFAEMPNEQFELVKNCDASRAMILIRALLEKVGSRMVDSISIDASARISPDDITLTDIDEHGVAAVVAGERKTAMLFGSVEYLQKYGIRVSPKSDGKYDDLCKRLLCVAINQRITALFLTRYRLEGDVARLIELLAAEDVELMVRTKDPGINRSLNERLCADDAGVVGVVKPTAREMDINTDRVDVSVVALDSAKAAAKTFAICRRIRRASRLGKLWQGLSVALGAGLAALLTYFGKINTFSALLVTLYLLFFCALHGLSSYLYLQDGDAE